MRLELPAAVAGLVAKPRLGDQAGFTLIEALVALAVVGVSLSAIGAVFGANLQTTRQLEDRLKLDGTGELILTALPDRGAMRPGPSSGVLAGIPWRMEVKPLIAGDKGQPPAWLPVAVIVTLTAPSGQTLRLDTVRLTRPPPASGG